MLTSTVAAARTSAAAGSSSLSRQSHAAFRPASSRTQRALGRRLLQCRADHGSNGNGNGNGKNGNGNGNSEKGSDALSSLNKAADKAGLSMGPISLTFGGESLPLNASPIQMTLEGGSGPERDFGEDDDPDRERFRLNSLSTEEWQKKYIKDGAKERPTVPAAALLAT